MKDYIEILKKKLQPSEDIYEEYIQGILNYASEKNPEDIFLLGIEVGYAEALNEVIRELEGRNDKLQKAALMLLDLGLEYDYSNPDLYTTIETIREGQS